MSQFVTGSGVMGLLAILFYWASVARLKRRDPIEYARMGQPDGFHHDTKLSSWGMAAYMFSCQFVRQGDVVLAALGTLWYASFLLTIGLFIWEVAS
jgi:hypothetical protein